MSDGSPYCNYEYNAICEVGLRRQENQDNCLCLPEEGIYVVADGMGGASDGRLASKMLVENIAASMGGMGDISPGERKYSFHQALHQVNKDITAHCLAQGYKSMGTTVVGLLFNPWNAEMADIVHCGDSRCYCFRQGELHLLTRDHSLVNTETGMDWATTQKYRHILTNHIGCQNYMTATWTPVSVCPDDIFLLCSDGLTSMVLDARIHDLMLVEETPEQINNVLKDEILMNGATDNFTLICVKIPSELPAALPFTEDDQKESDLLYALAEQRRDCGE